MPAVSWRQKDKTLRTVFIEFSHSIRPHRNLYYTDFLKIKTNV